ncbi:hypothetical protein K0M31_006491 [Melipona bicolor]|uniref:Uncharacterized protein n=1 Tax=Melipona bicolor TaxID=60889 RepID=A0AA40FTS1_9HYME|nr:hypothetical protein K0M31_006489 [Melipona bicolor]KAK1125151.1 hypothetical protein K0M31_006491 [Melipona bicolor]
MAPWSGGFSVWLGGNLRLKGRSDNFQPLSLGALNPTEFQGDLISCKISGNRGWKWPPKPLPASTQRGCRSMELRSLVKGEINNLLPGSQRETMSFAMESKAKRGLVGRILQPRSGGG